MTSTAIANSTTDPHLPPIFPVHPSSAPHSAISTPHPSAGQQLIPINYGQSPGIIQLNFFLGRDIHFGPEIKPPADAPAPPPPPPGTKAGTSTAPLLPLVLTSKPTTSSITTTPLRPSAFSAPRSSAGPTPSTPTSSKALPIASSISASASASRCAGRLTSPMRRWPTQSSSGQSDHSRKSTSSS